MLENVVARVVYRERIGPFAAHNLILAGFVTGEISVRILENRSNEPFADLCDLLGACLVRIDTDFRLVHQAVAKNLGDERDQAVECQDRLAEILAALFNDGIPLVAHGEFCVILARQDIMLIEAVAPFIFGAHVIEKSIFAVEACQCSLTITRNFAVLARNIVPNARHAPKLL